MNEFDSPQSRTEAILQNMLGAENELKPPQSRVEKILLNMLGETVELEPPQSREEELLMQLLENGGSGGSSVTVEPLTVTQNGTQTAPEGKAYSPVTVNVPNSYTASDVGKVVIARNGTRELTGQDDITTDTNGHLNTIYTKSVDVNVQPRPVYSISGRTNMFNPFSELDFDSLYNEISNGRLSGYVYWTFNGMPVQIQLYAREGLIGGMAFGAYLGQGYTPVGVEAGWDSYGVGVLDVLMGGQITDMADDSIAQIPCSVVLYGTTAPTPAT